MADTKRCHHLSEKRPEGSMAENLNIFDFELYADDMAVIALLDEKHSFFIDHHDGQMAK